LVRALPGSFDNFDRGQDIAAATTGAAELLKGQNSYFATTKTRACTRFFQTLAVAFLLANPQSGAAQTSSAPRFLLACAACHGFDGIGHDGSVPNLAGQGREYLHNQLNAFRTGQRKHPEMNFFSGQMTQEELQQIVDYHSGCGRDDCAGTRSRALIRCRSSLQQFLNVGLFHLRLRI